VGDARALALAHPLPPGGDTRPYVTRARLPDGRVTTACLTTEVCGCLGPVWHVSVSTQQPGVELLDDEHLAHLVAHKMLAEVGVPERELWWWNPEAKVGHLRVHLTNGERLQMGPGVEELPDDHEEPGVWLERNAPIVAKEDS
jgi:hypothetical protein